MVSKTCCVDHFPVCLALKDVLNITHRMNKKCLMIANHLSLLKSYKKLKVCQFVGMSIKQYTMQAVKK